MEFRLITIDCDDEMAAVAAASPTVCVSEIECRVLNGVLQPAPPRAAAAAGCSRGGRCEPRQNLSRSLLPKRHRFAQCQQQLADNKLRWRGNSADEGRGRSSCPKAVVWRCQQSSRSAVCRAMIIRRQPTRNITDSQI